MHICVTQPRLDELIMWLMLDFTAAGKHNKINTFRSWRWLTFCRWHIQIHFSKDKFLIFQFKFHWILYLTLEWAITVLVQVVLGNWLILQWVGSYHGSTMTKIVHIKISPFTNLSNLSSSKTTNKYSIKYTCFPSQHMIHILGFIKVHYLYLSWIFYAFPIKYLWVISTNLFLNENFVHLISIIFGEWITGSGSKSWMILNTNIIFHKTYTNWPIMWLTHIYHYFWGFFGFSNKKKMKMHG